MMVAAVTYLMQVRARKVLLLTAMLATALGGMSPAAAAPPDDSPEAIFQRRILPIFRSPKPSSCVECHLSGVDLKDYIKPSQEQTFAALRDQGLIDLERPRASKILRLINMGAEDEQKSDRPRVSQEARRAELEAFTAWIEAACGDPALREAPSLPEGETAGPDRPDEVIRHNRIDRVLDSFERNVWALRFRCNGCHMATGHAFARLKRENGEKMEWMKPDSTDTMRYLIDKKLIDVDRPEKSLLLLKPLNKVEHGGGLKMARGDTDYLAFLSWIEDYARVAGDSYESAADLPPPTKRIGSEIWLRIEGVPEKWLGKTGLMTVHAWDTAAKSWRKAPAAVNSFNVRRNPRFGTFAQCFLMIEPAAGADTPELPTGEYLVRMYLDERPRATTDFDEALKTARHVGDAKVQSVWKPGFLRATVASFEKVSARP